MQTENDWLLCMLGYHVRHCEGRYWAMGIVFWQFTGERDLLLAGRLLLQEQGNDVCINIWWFVIVCNVNSIIVPPLQEKENS